MVLVVADDLSGAAELAGLAAEQGWSAEVNIGLQGAGDADFLVVDTQSRSCSPELAVERIERLCRLTAPLRLEWLYKKTDSVLRGNIVPETEALARGYGRERILLVPANPRKGRCLVEGRYQIDGVPLHQTVFARDPEYPRHSDRVFEALGKPGRYRRVRVERGRPCPDDGFLVPDVSSTADIEYRAGEVDDRTLPAGAAEFFTALVARFKGRRASREAWDGTGSGARLFVCGSLASWEQGIGVQAERKDIPVILPVSQPDWSQRVEIALSRQGTAMLAIGAPAPGRPNRSGSGGSRNWLPLLIDAAEKAIRRDSPERLYVEGGATANALLNRMGWSRLTALSSGMEGVGRLRPIGRSRSPEVFVKPGSYLWPDSVWNERQDS